MIIYDRENKKVLDSITLYLTPEEASELADDAKDLSKNPGKHHAHINDKDYKNEIVVTVYTESNIDQFDEESKLLIINNKNK